MSRRDLSPHVESNMTMSLLGALGGGGPTISLASEAPLLVRTSGRVVRVGTERPGTIGCVRPPSADAREVEVDFSSGLLGGHGLGGAGAQLAGARLFVAPARGETCAGQRPR